MTEHVSPLRQRMIDDMKIRNMFPNTQKAYIRAVAKFSKHFGKSPDKFTFEDVRAFSCIWCRAVCRPHAANPASGLARFFARAFFRSRWSCR